MKLSVITINLNNRTGLEKTMQSVFNQTFTDFEYIVIDGGSTDGSFDLIRESSHKIGYFVSEPDKGIYNAMNKAIVKATGEYCYFLNSGDYLVKNDVFERIFTGDPDASFICGNFICDHNGRLEKHTGYRNRDWTFALYDIFSGFLAHQAFFIKREMFGKYGLYDERLRIMSDWKLFFVAIGINGEKVHYSDVDISVYDMLGISSTIGGETINREKMQIAGEELSGNTFRRLERLYYLERNGFIVDYIRDSKIRFLIFRFLFKVYNILKKN